MSVELEGSFLKGCYDFKNIFAEKFSKKKLAFLTQNKAKLCKILIITLVFEKNANFFGENCRKSQKIVIITSTPGFGKQGCQMVYFHTKTTNFGRRWMELWEFFITICGDLLYFMTIWYILGASVIFSPFLYIVSRKNLAILVKIGIRLKISF
jgi:hypothetical protein